MALLATQKLQITGTAPTYTSAAGGGDTVKAGPRTVLHVVNGDASPHTATVVVPGTRFGQALADVAVAVPAGEERFIGPLTSDLATNGVVSITYDAVTSVTVAALSV